MGLNIFKYVGWRNWAVFYYNSVFENIFVFFYIALCQSDLSSGFFLKIILFLVFSVFSTTYGYLINDYADRELDKAHGKSNTFAGDSAKKALAVVVLFLIVSLIAAYPFWNNPLFWLTWLIWLSATSFYSLPPVRFKERGRIGLILVVLAQRVLPLILIFVSFRFDRMLDALLLLIYILLRGASSDINHQLEDYDKDLATATQTSVVQMGIRRSQKLFLIVLSLERVAFLFILTLIALQFGNFTVKGFALFWLPLALYVVLWFSALVQRGRVQAEDFEGRNPYNRRKNIYQVIHLVFPNIILPAFFIFYILLNNPLYGFFILFFIFIYRLYDLNTLRNSFFKKWIS